MCTQQTNTSTNQRTNNNKNTHHKKNTPTNKLQSPAHTAIHTGSICHKNTSNINQPRAECALCACLHSTLSTALNTLQNSTKTTAKNDQDQQYEISSQQRETKKRGEWQRVTGKGKIAHTV
jgi:hypothetical protein